MENNSYLWFSALHWPSAGGHNFPVSCFLMHVDMQEMSLMCSSLSTFVHNRSARLSVVPHFIQLFNCCFCHCLDKMSFNDGGSEKRRRSCKEKQHDGD